MKYLDPTIQIYTINHTIRLDMFNPQIKELVATLEEGKELHY